MAMRGPSNAAASISGVRHWHTTHGGVKVTMLDGEKVTIKMCRQEIGRQTAFTLADTVAAMKHMQARKAG